MANLSTSIKCEHKALRNSRRDDGKATGLTFGCALANSLFLSLFPSFSSTWVWLCCVLCCGSSRAVGQNEYMGASPCFFFLPSERTDNAEMLCTIYCRHCRPRTFPPHHRIDSLRSAGRHTRYDYSPRYVSPPSWVTQDRCPRLLHERSRTCVMHIIRRVELRIIRGALAMVRGA